MTDKGGPAAGGEEVQPDGRAAESLRSASEPFTALDSGRARILVCDDSRTIQTLVESVLGGTYDLLTVASAEQALARATAFAPDLFISDLVMPGMNGNQLCQEVRRLPGLGHVPFILLTSKTDDESRATGLEAGADDYLFKPLRPRELLARVRSLLRLRFAHLELERQKLALEQANQKLSLLAFQDGLTGLYNHRCFQERLLEEIGRARRYGRLLTLVLFDLDHFKQLNDRFGHLVGDEALKCMGKLLMGELDPQVVKRASDIAARYGGEELVLLLPETDRGGGVVKAQRVCEAAARVRLSVPAAHFTLSAGVAEFPRDAGSSQELLQRADEALYHAKRAGRNRVVAQGDFPVADGSEGVALLRSYRAAANETSEVLRRDRYLVVFYIDLHELSQVEKEYGSGTSHDALRGLIDAMIDDDSGVLAASDIVTTGQSGRIGLVIVPNRPDRAGRPPEAGELETERGRLASVVERSARARLAELVAAPMRVGVGYSLGIYSQHYSHERQIELLVRDAAASAMAFRSKQAELQKIDLQLVLLEGHLFSAYQPIVAADGRRVFGYEALVRGPVASALASPLQLLRAARQADLEWELDRGCLRAAFAHGARLPAGTHLCVNVLPSTLYDRDFVSTGLAGLVAGAGLTPDRVIVEVTEQSVISNLGRFREALAPLRSAGIKIALDDVGVANANLEQVNAIVPDYLKLDRIIVTGVATLPPRLELIRSLVSLARSIGAKVVAEGVERREDWTHLCDAGVDYLQGYYFARPGPPFPEVETH
jgi:diguanylate cyclase (GGDEF)-like protein